VAQHAHGVLRNIMTFIWNLAVVSAIKEFLEADDISTGGSGLGRGLLRGPTHRPSWSGNARL